LLALADYYHRGEAVKIAPPGCVAVAVVGAHLSGQPLNGQLTGRGARLMKTCRTAPGYRLFALDGTAPPKPGLIRDSRFQGEGIEVEVWAVPEDRFGGFVAAVPAPLGIGSATLDSGEVVKCFICEGYAIESATEITQFGGWRNYLRGSRG
jgi:allophanate hydrolase